MKEQLIMFAAGAMFAGVFRLSLGRIVLREQGAWCFRISRFDVEDARINDKLISAYEAGLYEGTRCSRAEETQG